MSARVLVVDDIPANVKLMEARLTSEYYDVLTARNGLEAIDVVQKNAVDIILLDVMMPELDGFETCKRLKAMPEVSHIPVVMVTALSDVSDRISGLKAGADDFLTKPTNDVALFARIRSLVRLKIMTDELRLRDETGSQFGMMASDPGTLDSAGASILVVDDDRVQAQNMMNKLKELGHNVDLELEPQHVVEKVLHGNYDLAIISTQLSGADGLRLCSQIRSHEKVRHLPLLILVEEHDMGLLVKGLDMGVNDYLMIPMDYNELVARVNTQVKRKRYQDALKSNYQKNVSMAVTDSLTGLYNRRYFDAHFNSLFQKARETGKSLTLMIADIDHFKKINDNYGHVAGDEILRKVPERIVQNVRLTDLVARYGGEEFVVVMPDTSLPSAENIAERVRASMEGSVFEVNIGDTKTLPCTVSIGMAALTESDTPQSLLMRADKGLYLSKEAGRNRVTVVDGNA